MRALVTTIVAVVLATGCAGTPAPNVTLYDFSSESFSSGPGIRLNGSLLVEGVRAPSWFDTSDIVYRLAYQDPFRRQAYTESRWVGPPEELLTQRLRQKLDQVIESGVAGSDDGIASNYLLRVDLEEFTQVFDSADTSRAVVRIRASLIDVAQRRLIAQDFFSAAPRTPTPNASGAVHGLRVASDAVIDALAIWLIERLKAGPGK